ncbi:hypothetical protein F5146DRAFT_304571 [Armillaria mellea]|nr:hypothetical protein F5146DRAFT_304571 [Armillaria mellea]
MGTWNLRLVIFISQARLDALFICSTQVMRAAGHPPQLTLHSQCLFLLCGTLHRLVPAISYSGSRFSRGSSSGCRLVSVSCQRLSVRCRVSSRWSAAAEVELTSVSFFSANVTQNNGKKEERSVDIHCSDKEKNLGGDGRWILNGTCTD